jgi:apolipoprotein D and lipocalin family protein
MRAIATSAAVLALTGCASMGPASVVPLKTTTVDPAKFYSGTWYEIGRRPMGLTDGCVAGGTTYTRTGDLKVRVLDFCHQGSPTGQRKTIGGPAHITDPGTFGKLHVSYRLFNFIPVPRDYWVLDRAEDYSWFISADPTLHDLWIYTRRPDPSPELVKTLTERAKALGYDTGLLEFPTPGKGEPAAG